MTVGELRSRMSAREFAEWQGFFAVEPFGGPVDDLRFGTVAATAGAAWGAKTSPSDYFQWTPAAPHGDWRDIQAEFAALAPRGQPG